MKNRYTMLAAFLLVAASATVAMATPVPNSAQIMIKVEDQSPTSTPTSTNNYPTGIRITDSGLSGCAFANRHAWLFSEDGGATRAQFANNSMFRYAADFNYSGPGDGEGGLMVSPWWDATFGPGHGGQFMCNARSGEVACFGGRLPFYSFTVNHGVTYVKGTTVRLEIIYQPHDLNAGNPGTIIYNYITNPWLPAQHTYSSGPLPFDQANPAEDPPHGLYGILNGAEVGGYTQMYLDCGNEANKSQADWNNITVMTDAATAVKTTTWGSIRKLYK
jgi:hypothetical protein